MVVGTGLTATVIVITEAVKNSAILEKWTIRS